MIQVLIVDDDVHSTEGVRQAVNWTDYSIAAVFTANSMKQACRILKGQKIDILFLDIEMPKGSGFELLEWARENGYQPVVTMLTSYASFPYAQQAIRYRCLSYLLKPSSMEELSQAVSKAVQEVQRLRTHDEEHTMASRYQEELGFGLSEPESDGQRVVKKVKQYVKENLAEDIGRDDVAKACFLSPDYVSRVFRQETGIKLSDYITEKRMELARRLLLTTDLSIGEIAGKSGYGNLAYFTKVFRIRNGVPPAEYRAHPQNKV